MSRIAIIGATGRAGSQLLDEALCRGHHVTAISRNAVAALSGRAGVSPVDADLGAPAALIAAVKGHHAVFSAARFLSASAAAVIDSVKAAGVPRLLVVGGAASLRAANQQRLLDTPQFPPEYRAEATAGAVFLDALRAEAELDWTFLSPSALFVEGPRTGKFRLGKDDLLIGEDGRSSISFADFAIAFLDEFERPAHTRQRFTVGY
jgi:putative NADH-flavin reductase